MGTWAWTYTDERIDMYLHASWHAAIEHELIGLYAFMPIVGEWLDFEQ